MSLDDWQHIVIDTIKKAEDSDKIIVRLYERIGKRATVSLSGPLPIKSVWRCNLLEQNEEDLEWADNHVALNFTPFQIITLKLELDI